MRARDAVKIFGGSLGVYVLVAACAGQIVTDPVPQVAAEPTSGKRLKRKFRVGEDGSKEYVQVALPSTSYNGSLSQNTRGVWYDAERKEDCVFRTAADGAQRCLPFTQSGSFAFSDDACTKLVAIFTAALPDCPEEAAPTYLIVEDPSSTQCKPDSLAFGITIYAVGAALDPKLPLYNVVSDGTCKPENLSPTPPSALYAVKGEVPATSFVKATIAVDP